MTNNSFIYFLTCWMNTMERALYTQPQHFIHRPNVFLGRKILRNSFTTLSLFHFLLNPSVILYFSEKFHMVNSFYREKKEYLYVILPARFLLNRKHRMPIFENWRPWNKKKCPHKSRYISIIFVVILCLFFFPYLRNSILGKNCSEEITIFNNKLNSIINFLKKCCKRYVLN